MIIGDCHKLVTIFPPYMVGRFHNLGILEVIDCKSVEEIFNFHQPTPQISGEDETSLRVVKLQRLPKLKHVWNKDPQGLLNFQILQDVFVCDCPSLENLFPFSIANDLTKLEKLRILRCDGMKEIVAKGDVSDISNLVFKYPKLKGLGLVHLPELRCFYRGTHAIELQALTCLFLGHCDKLEAFGTETTHSEMKPIFSSLAKVISNLEVLGIYGLKERKWLQDTIGNNVYLMRNTKELHFERLSSIEILFWFLHIFPNLESLNLFNSVLKEVLSDGSHAFLEKIGTVVRLKNMSLWYSDIPLNIGFENGAILQRVEKLCIVECHYLANLTPSSLALTQLSHLEVSNCNKLKSLLTSSTAKTLVQLTMMKVSQCAMMEEIVTVEENEEVKQDEIVFGKLRSLELVSLRNLSSFCNSQCKLVFQCPLLEEVKVSDCLKLEKFSEKILSPNLEKVDIVEGEEGDKWYWEGDLNATIQKIFTDKVLFESCQNMELSCYPGLQQLWREEISSPTNCFNNLRTLIVKNCSFLSEVFPSRLLPYFKKLEELQVSSSPVKVIFDIDGNNLTEIKGKPFHLKRVTLDGLQNLKCIWSKDPHSIMSFPNLKEIVVSNCAGIKNLFPASLARNLVRLKKLEIRQCHALEEIVGKEEAVAEGASRKFEFHYLTTLTMYHLPSLKFFYPGRYTLEFSSLVSLSVFDCNKLEIFASDFRSHQGAIRCEDEANISASRKSLFMDGKVIQNLEFLTLSGNDMMMLSHGYFPDNLLHKLKTLRLHFGDSYEAGATLPFKFFQKLPNLERLMVSNCNALDEVFPSQRPKDTDHIINILAQVRELELDSLPLLSSIGLDYSWVDSIVKNLRALRMMNCPRLTILVPSSALSFCNLKELRIEQCHGLVSLFSSSVAKRLVQLRRMAITECGSITHVVSHEIDESDSDDIIFERLKYITLRHLPSLVSFYSGNATLEFSALIVHAIEQCPKMKCFSQGIVRAPNLKGIQYFRDNESDWHNYSDLNTTMGKLFNEKLEQFTCGVQDLKLGDHPELGDIWHGAMSVPNGGFSKLKTLIVDGCPFLSHYVIPFYLLRFLNNLEDLQVRNCYSIRAVFEVGSWSTPFSFPLKSMTLEELPNLEQVWNEDPREILSFQSLQHVYVRGCGSLKSLFPASILKRKLESLEILEVICCEGLVEIAAREETALEESARNLVIFPSLTDLRLLKLPELRCICSGLSNVEWPKLKELDVFQCGQLKNIGLEDKVFPNLEHLSLCKEDIMDIRQAPFPENLLQRAKILKLHGFFDDSDVFPYGFFKKESLPHVEKFAVSHNNFKRIFTSERSDLDCCADEFFSQLKTLELISLSKLYSIGLEQSPLPGNLEILKVTSCPCLINLAPSTVSFSILRVLDVSGCDGLVNLFTSSTAKSLASLEDLTVSNCGSMREIVAKEEDESDQHEIAFENLKNLKLKSLPSLDSFCTGAYHLKFTCLERVSIYNCSQMKVFSDADIDAPDNVTIASNGDLRDMIEKAFKKAT
ncbi:uncharacterized protein LOC114738939 [Neltuma alba]|uniref:uncharacterized protein LOC114738939 n=1 Tax=Neltuma alba TaxID=207710 RepID=UPI0010A4E773|nr:uncharacterized protein LOC114738939 [Prosopis alba]